MKNIIGINLSHDSGVCLISGSELIIAINEERLSRKKVDHRFPKNTLKYVSELAESKGIKIDTIAYSYSSKEDTYTIDMIINDNKRNIFYHFKRFIVYFVAGLLPIYNNYLNRKGTE
jgi:predicted NodU family carbamoyl transferase